MRMHREILKLATWLPVLCLTAGLYAFPQTLSAQETVYKSGQLTEQPKIADAKQARSAILRSYTTQLQEAGLEGEVQVAFIVNADGTVDASSITVVSSPADGLSKAAEVAVTRLKFQPGQKDGKPVRCEVLIPIKYTRG
jgi:TonB family protein